MHIVGWTVWYLSALWAAIELRLFLYTCWGRSLRDQAYPHEWRQRLFGSGFSLLTVASALLLTVLFGVPKLHLLWIAPVGFVLGIVVASILFPNPQEKIHRQMIVRLRDRVRRR